MLPASRHVELVRLRIRPVAFGRLDLHERRVAERDAVEPDDPLVVGGCDVRGSVGIDELVPRARQRGSGLGLPAGRGVPLPDGEGHRARLVLEPHLAVSHPGFEIDALAARLEAVRRLPLDRVIALVRGQLAARLPVLPGDDLGRERVVGGIVDVVRRSRVGVLRVPGGDGGVGALLGEGDAHLGRPREVSDALARAGKEAVGMGARVAGVHHDVERRSVPGAAERVPSVGGVGEAVVEAVAPQHGSVRHGHVEEVAVIVGVAGVHAVHVRLPGHRLRRVGVRLALPRGERGEEPDCQDCAEQQARRAAQPFRWPGRWGGGRGCRRGTLGASRARLRPCEGGVFHGLSFRRARRAVR